MSLPGPPLPDYVVPVDDHEHQEDGHHDHHHGNDDESCFIVLLHLHLTHLVNDVIYVWKLIIQVKFQTITSVYQWTIIYIDGKLWTADEA